jgi:hypothetical protein
MLPRCAIQGGWIRTPQRTSAGQPGMPQRTLRTSAGRSAARSSTRHSAPSRNDAEALSFARASANSVLTTGFGAEHRTAARLRRRGKGR